MLFAGNLSPIRQPVFFKFLWLEKNRKRDLDNIAFAKKFILDALVRKGVLPTDNQSVVKGFTDNFDISDKSGVLVKIYAQ